MNRGDLHKGTVCLNSRERTVSKTWTSHVDEMLYTFMIFNFFPPHALPCSPENLQRSERLCLLLLKQDPKINYSDLGRSN